MKNKRETGNGKLETGNVRIRKFPASRFRFPVPRLLFLLAACAPASRPPPTPTGVLLIHCPVPDASLWVDERLVGELRLLPAGVRVAAGPHRVELRHDRYHTRYAEATVAAGQRVELDLTLAEALP
jgi:hypothetical protein